MKKLLLSLALVAVIAPSAEAQYSLLTARSQVGGTGLINWSSLGASTTSLSNPFNVAVSNTSLTATFSKPGQAGFERRDQGSGWDGNFTVGDDLLWTQASPEGPTTMTLSGNVSAFGSQLQTDYYGTFNMRVSALDALGNVLAFFDVQGSSTSLADGSAIFVGISSALGNIRGVRWEGLDGVTNPNDFAMNDVSINTAATTVPEPGTWALMTAGLFALGVVARRRRQV